MFDEIEAVLVAKESSEISVDVVLELLSTGHLHNLANCREGRFLGEEIRQLMAELARGLTGLHSFGIMHRDIKP
jgi:serine/threonine protein kinase